ncbi:DUF1015 domain-containing protein [Chloroflexota bacterium]
MAEIRPFRGVHYSESLDNDLSDIICPVYDIITSPQQQELYLKNEYNFVRLEFGRELPQDTAADNKYTRSASTLENWLEQGILAVDKAPALYLHEQYFTYQGRGYKRRGITCLVRLEEWDKMIVRPHEGTLADPKSDRISLLRALQANTSPVLAFYEDRLQQISPLLTAQERHRPMISVRDVDGESHDVWAITDPEVINQVSSSLTGQSIYIADGHHRYESALAYQREKRAYSASVSGDEPFNFVMMTLVESSDSGLLILPPHRLVRGISKSALNELVLKLPVFFEIESLPLKVPDVWEQVDRLLAGTDKISLVLFGMALDRILVLSLRDMAAVGQMMPHFHSELYKSLDVSIVDHLILEELLGLDREKEKALLAYSYDRMDALNRVLVQEYQLALLISPARVEMIKAIADVGDKMPRKSTYFYPKLPAGLIFNRLV